MAWTGNAADGTFSFAVHEGLSYSVVATRWDAGKVIEASSGPIVVGNDGEPGPVTVMFRERAQ